MLRIEKTIRTSNDWRYCDTVDHLDRHQVDHYTSVLLNMINRISTLLEREQLGGFIVRSKVPYVNQE